MIPEPRYAIYLAPEPHEPLWLFGSAWLGYDAATRADVKHPVLSEIAPQAIREATAHPRLYGLHVTLKAPFRLADGIAPDELQRAVQDLAQRHDPVGPFPLTLEARKAGEDQIFLCLAPLKLSTACIGWSGCGGDTRSLPRAAHSRRNRAAQAGAPRAQGARIS